MAEPDAPRAVGKPTAPSSRPSRSLRTTKRLLVQSGKPVGVFKTHDHAPRVLIANSNLVGHWSNWEKFNELERAGLMMYGQMTAGSWIYIGSQGIVQGTFETFSAAGEKHFGGDLAGKLIVSGGMGGMGGAQPLAATMTGAAFLGIDVDPERIKKRLKTGYCDFMVTTLDEALRILKNAIRKKENVSVGLVGNCADVIPELAERGVVPDILTDQTSAHDPLNGYVPNGMTLQRRWNSASAIPKTYQEKSLDAMARHVEGMLRLQKMGSVTFDYGNNIRTFAFQRGVKNAYDFPGFVPAYIRPLFCEGRGPFRWVALSGEPSDIHVTDDLVLRALSREPHPAPLDRSGAKAHQVPGTARTHLLARIRRARPVRPGHERSGEEGQDQSAHRNRTRSSRLRLGGVSLPRNRKHERRLATPSPTGRC